MPFSSDQLSEIPDILSAPRFATYLQHSDGNKEKALELYQWNVKLSSAFIIPLHLLEISIRNAVVECLEKVYSENWPWDQNFIISLPDFDMAYSPRKDVRKIASSVRNPTAGKVVAELKFAFWEKMFTKRHDKRIWNEHIKEAFPYAPESMSPNAIRKQIFDDINPIRRLRNRIAHHEPIFHQDVESNYNKIFELISWRSEITANWMQEIQSVVDLISRGSDNSE